MKRSALVLPGTATAVAVAAASLGLFQGPVTSAASPLEPETSFEFEATFDTPDDFYDRFDYGYSGPNPWDWGNGSGAGAVTSFHGDHSDDVDGCEGPTTVRNVTLGGDREDLDFDQLFWWCAPRGPESGHIMTGVDTVSYNIAWFSPKPLFENVSRVCWDINLTELSRRKWTQVMFVSEADAVRNPSPRGSGGFDLGYTSPDFRQDAPNTGIFPDGGTMAGFKSIAGNASWFEDQDEWTTKEVGSLIEGVTDKATRYTHCLSNEPGNVVRLTQDTPTGTRTIDMAGQIPSHPVRVVFQDDNYDPPKDERYRTDTLTWHWDDVRVEATASRIDATVPSEQRGPAASPEVAAEAASPLVPHSPDGSRGPSGYAATAALLGLLLGLAGLAVLGLLRSVGPGSKPSSGPASRHHG